MSPESIPERVYSRVTSGHALCTWGKMVFIYKCILTYVNYIVLFFFIENAFISKFVVFGCNCCNMFDRVQLPCGLIVMLIVETQIVKTKVDRRNTRCQMVKLCNT